MESTMAATVVGERTPLVLGRRLTLTDLVSVARRRRRVTPMGTGSCADDRQQRMEASAAWVEQCVTEIARAEDGGPAPNAYYGINTGFGVLAGRYAFSNVQQAHDLSRRLV